MRRSRKSGWTRDCVEVQMSKSNILEASLARRSVTRPYAVPCFLFLDGMFAPHSLLLACQSVGSRRQKLQTDRLGPALPDLFKEKLVLKCVTDHCCIYDRPSLAKSEQASNLVGNLCNPLLLAQARPSHSLKVLSCVVQRIPVQTVT